MKGKPGSSEEKYRKWRFELGAPAIPEAEAERSLGAVNWIVQCSYCTKFDTSWAATEE